MQEVPEEPATMTARRTPHWLFKDCAIVADIPLVQGHVDYPAAKAGSLRASFELAWHIVIAGHVARFNQEWGSRQPILLPVQAIEGVSVNQIPAAVAAVLQAHLGWPVDSGIVQINRVSHTKASGWHRIVNQALFDGPVETGKDYVLVDDFIGQGGTFANLKGWVERHGGRVVGAVALAGKAYSATLELSSETLTQLRIKHGDLESWWRGRFGFGFDALTESEGRYLLRAENADTVRNRLVAAE